VIEPRHISFDKEAIAALSQIVGIMTDQVQLAERHTRWNVEHLIDLDERFFSHEDGQPITLGIEDAALLLEGMAFTEIMSVEFPWFEMVQWTTDFVTTELRQHWTQEEWEAFAGRDQ
jgi:hypothetical protein